MKLKAKVMQILVADLQPNLIGAFYIMSSGIEMPDTVTKTDLTNIISFLCKKLDWIEELNETASAKSSEEKDENSMSHDHDISVDSEIINKDQSPSMKDWIEDGLSGPIEGNSEEEVDSFHNTLPPVSDYFDEIDFTQGIGIAKENVPASKIPVMKSELEINPIGGSETKEEQERHEKIYNEGLRGSFICSHCGKMFTLSEYMKRHIKRVHTNPTYKPFSCSYCDKTFKDKHKKKIHEMTHTGEKPYKCPICEYKCSTSYSLKIHQRNHTGDMFSCSKCDKKFPVKSKMAVHELTHDDA